MEEEQQTYDEQQVRASRVTGVSMSSFLPKRKRSLTDRCWLILLLLTWIGMTIIGLASIGTIHVRYIKQGNPNYLLHGVDYEGNICGVTSIVSHLPKQVYPNLFGTNKDSQNTTVPTLTAVCAASCPLEGESVLDVYGNYGSWIIPGDTADFVNTCLYLNENRVDTSGMTILSDFLHCYEVIALLGFCLAIVCSIGFLFVTRIPMVLRSIVWGCVLSICLLTLGGGYFLITEAKNQDSRSDSNSLNSTEIELLNGLGGTLCTLGVLWMCFICFMRKRISLAIQIIRESASALTHMPLLLFLPLLQTILFASFSCLWLFYTIYLISSGTLTTHVDSTTGLSYQTISYDENSQRAILYMMFSWLWTIGFIEAMGQIVSAHCVLRWYFAEVRKEITSLQVFSSIFCMMRYHMGTAAFGSLLIACIRSMRMILEYLKYHTAKAASPSSSTVSNCGNRLVLCVFGCFQCLLGCFEKFIKYLNKHAYIQTAMKGSSFIPSAMKAFRLLVKNLGRFAAVTVIGDLVVFIGKISISLSCAALGYLYLTTYMANQLNGFVLPTVFIFFLAFFTCTMFLGVLSATADTLLQACLVDEEYIHSGNAGKYHSTLKELVVEQQEHWKSANTTYDRYEDNEGEDDFYLEGTDDDDEYALDLPRYAANRDTASIILPTNSYSPLQYTREEEERKEEAPWPIPPPPRNRQWLEQNAVNPLQRSRRPNNVETLYDASLAFNPGARNNRYSSRK